MQITNKLCAVTLIQCCLWVLCCHTLLAAVSVPDGARRLEQETAAAIEGESAEIISGRPKIIYGTNSISISS